MTWGSDLECNQLGIGWYRCFDRDLFLTRMAENCTSRNA